MPILGIFFGFLRVRMRASETDAIHRFSRERFSLGHPRIFPYNLVLIAVMRYDVDEGI